MTKLSMLARRSGLLLVSCVLTAVSAQEVMSPGAVQRIDFDTLPAGRLVTPFNDPGRHFTLAATKRGPFLYGERAMSGMRPLSGGYLAIRPGVGDTANLTSIVLAPGVRGSDVSFDYWIETPGEQAAGLGCTFSSGPESASWSGAGVHSGSYACHAPPGATVREIHLRTRFDGGVLRIDNLVVHMGGALAKD